MSADVTIIGGGLAGCEAARVLAGLGHRVRLVEMRPLRTTEAHKTGDLAELVCSNSLGSLDPGTAKGLLLEELRTLGSLVVAAAQAHAVPAGASLAVEREGFARMITGAIAAEPRIEVVTEECLAVPPQGPVLISTGPLTSPALSASLRELTGQQSLFFYDAIAPIVTAESIDRSVVFAASRYDKGGPDFLNCPLTREDYETFVDTLLAGDTVPTKDFEQAAHFEGCMPIEELAARGPKTLAFGPMKPVGLIDPATGRRPFAVVQLRREDREGQLYNLVGFQTKLRYGEQSRIFRGIPGLGQAEFVRLGSMHRNTFIAAPAVLAADLSLRWRRDVWLAGQITGVEGYAESSAVGLMAALSIAARLAGRHFTPPPRTTMIGALLAFLREADPATFQPMNSTFGLLPPLVTPPLEAPRVGRKGRSERREAMGQRARQALAEWIDGEPATRSLHATPPDALATR